MWKMLMASLARSLAAVFRYPVHNVTGLCFLRATSMLIAAYASGMVVRDIVGMLGELFEVIPEFTLGSGHC
jgi:hypothetical protein